jgi:hypothetical protein
VANSSTMCTTPNGLHPVSVMCLRSIVKPRIIKVSIVDSWRGLVVRVHSSEARRLGFAKSLQRLTNLVLYHHSISSCSIAGWPPYRAAELRNWSADAARN